MGTHLGHPGAHHMSKWKKGPGTTYGEKLKDPRWQKRRLEILERDGWACCSCGSPNKTLHVHHRWYESGAEPWDAPPAALVTLCEGCHEAESGERAELEERILRALRRHFLTDELIPVVYGLEALKLPNTPSVVACILGGLFANEERLAALVEDMMAPGPLAGVE